MPRLSVVRFDKITYFCNVGEVFFGRHIYESVFRTPK